jgi:hypothetical protein
MTWAVVRGQYKGGMVQPLEKMLGRDGTEVLILFPDYPVLVEAPGAWEQIEQAIAREMPDLTTMSTETRQTEFDRLSEKVAQNMPYRTREEFERAMRGDDYGLARY